MAARKAVGVMHRIKAALIRAGLACVCAALLQAPTARRVWLWRWRADSREKV